jgi:hypothetical protein
VSDQLAILVSLGAAVVIALAGAFGKGIVVPAGRLRGLAWLVLILAALAMAGLAATGYYPALAGHQPLGGYPLLIHTTLSGAFMGLLPLVALLWAERLGTRRCGSLILRLAFWLALLLGLTLAATMLLGMTPLFGSEGLHQLLETHRWAGVALPPVAAVWFFMRSRRAA